MKIKTEKKTWREFSLWARSRSAWHSLKTFASNDALWWWLRGRATKATAGRLANHSTARGRGLANQGGGAWPAISLMAFHHRHIFALAHRGGLFTLQVQFQRGCQSDFPTSDFKWWLTWATWRNDAKYSAEFRRLPLEKCRMPDWKSTEYTTGVSFHHSIMATERKIANTLSPKHSNESKTTTTSLPQKYHQKNNTQSLHSRF